MERDKRVVCQIKAEENRYPFLLESIGNTPLVERKNIKTERGVRILVKLEGHNPGGSVKDRPGPCG